MQLFFLNTPIPSFKGTYTSNSLTGALWSLHLLQSQHNSKTPCALSNITTKHKRMNRGLDFVSLLASQSMQGFHKTTTDETFLRL